MLLFISIFCIIFGSFLLYRNNWVFKTSMKWNNKVSLYATMLINEGIYTTIKQQDAYNSIWNYQKMLYHFWIFDINKMVSDKEIYNAVIKSTKYKIPKKFYENDDGQYHNPNIVGSV